MTASWCASVVYSWSDHEEAVLSSALGVVGGRWGLFGVGVVG